MQPNAAPETNRAAEVVPEISHRVPWRVTSVTAVSDACLRVTFVDGTAGEVNMRALLNNPATGGTVFEPLRNPVTFNQAAVVLGAVQWPTGADLAPDAMYDAIRQHGRWVLD